MGIMSMTYRWRVYMHGCFASVANSVASTMTMAIVDPADFNPFAGGDWSKIGALVFTSAIIGFFTYIKTHPLPDPEKDTDYHAIRRDAITSLVEGPPPANPMPDAQMSMTPKPEDTEPKL